MRKIGTRLGLALVVTLLVFAMVGCDTLFGSDDSTEAPGGTDPDSPADNRDTLRVSMSANLGATSASGLSGSINASEFVIQPIIDDSFYKAERQGLSEVIPIATLTPEHFILQIDTIQLYRETETGYETAEIWDMTQLPPGEIIPQHVDLAYADRFIRDAEVTGTNWDGFMIQFLPGVGETNSIPQHSVIGVDLSGVEGITDTTAFLNGGDNLSEETADFTIEGSSARFFPFSGVQPLDVDFLSYIVIGTNFDGTGIQNPEGAMPPDSGSWDLPGGDTSGNASMIFSNSPTAIDFSAFENPEILFNWDLQDLIEVYEVGESYVLTLALDNPFPLSITVRDRPAATGDGGTAGTAPGDVLAPWIGRVDSLFSEITDQWNVMHWINPTDASFDRVVIVRKDGSYPTSPTDGDAVYEGHKPAFVDQEANPSDSLRYTIWAVSDDDQYSTGINFEPDI